MSSQVAIISDIHGNVHALRAVLRDIDERGITERVCLGDIVGYGGNPAECVDFIRSSGFRVIRGNHDAMVAGNLGFEGTSEGVREAIAWTRRHLNEEQLAWLAELPMTLEAADYECVHASLFHPGDWRYVRTPGEAALHFAEQRKPVCFIGHTHRPQFWLEGAEHPLAITNLENLRAGKKQIVNVGAVGQPRDGDDRACYVVYRRESQDVWWRRIPYGLEAAQSAIITAGLPSSFAMRLSAGR
jgi:diadenosine tetraphosphatase ApaH/serine/threonine PP2A family protein phosphatase